MSEFVKKKTGRIETDDRGSARGPNIPPTENLHQDPSALRKGECRYTKPDGSQCEANARRESFYCFFHDPDLAQEREAARKKGGKERSRKATVLAPDTPDKPLKTAEDIAGVLAQTINQVLRGELDPRIANSTGCLTGYWLKAHELGQIERRLAKLESINTHKWADPNVASVPTPESMAFDFVKANPGGEA
jgi:hypothetical protein